MAWRSEEWERNRELVGNGEYSFSLEIAPVSLQGTKEAKERLRSSVRANLSPLEFIFVGDVAVEIEWMIQEQSRYEGVQTPDVDNVLKPLLDAMAGPEGVLVDDCQVQAVHCFWIDSYTAEQRLNIRIRRQFVDEWLLKKGLFFVDLGNGLCMPFVEGAEPEDLFLMSLALQEARIELRDQLIAAGSSYYEAQRVMSVQRLFHRARVARFPVRSITEFDLDAHREKLGRVP